MTRTAPTAPDCRDQDRETEGAKLGHETFSCVLVSHYTRIVVEPFSDTHA
jgi:hypothetical protein